MLILCGGGGDQRATTKHILIILKVSQFITKRQVYDNIYIYIYIYIEYLGVGANRIVGEKCCRNRINV